MKRKLGIQDFADFIVQREGISRTEAETFVRAFFDVIEQGLEEDKFVKIKGLGTFKLIAVSERESININTGERFQISGHTKVSFTPDASMKELVNRPFAHFEAVDLNDDTDTKEFEEIDDEMQAERENVEEEDDTNDEEDVEEVSQEDDEPQLSKKLTVAVSSSQNSINLPTSIEESSHTVEDTSSTPSFAKDEEATDNKEEQPINIVSANDENNSAETNESDAETNKESAEDIIVTTPQSLQTPQPTIEETLEDKEREQKNSNATVQATQGYVYGEVPSPRKRNWWKMVAILCGILVLMALSYFAGYYRMLCPGCSEFSIMDSWSKSESSTPKQIASPTQPKTTNKPQQTFIADSATTSKLNNSPKEKTQVTPASTTTNENSKKLEISDKAPQKYEIPTTHIVKAGDNVYRISRKYYGSDAYAERIIKENNLKDANTIVVGMQLKMPRP